jgi:hypothetical protein
LTTFSLRRRPISTNSRPKNFDDFFLVTLHIFSLPSLQPGKNFSQTPTTAPRITPKGGGAVPDRLLHRPRQRGAVAQPPLPPLNTPLVEHTDRACMLTREKSKSDEKRLCGTGPIVPMLRKRSRPGGRRKFLDSRPKFSKSGHAPCIPGYRLRGLGAEASNPTPIGRTVFKIRPPEVLHARRAAPGCRRMPNIDGVYRRWAWQVP